MEIELAHRTETHISVTCNGQFSHTFDLHPLILKDEQELIDNPVSYGQKLYEALFPPDTSAQETLALTLEPLLGRVLFSTDDSDLDAIPWEYLYGPDGFLVLECHFVRGLPAPQRITTPIVDTSLHIVALPSHPLGHDVVPLDIAGEWMRLKESIEVLPYAITLERVYPPTIERLRQLVVNQKHCVIHFMGHGGQDERGAFLGFEQENGALNAVTARQFVQRVRGTAFLVTLNACASARPGPTPFSNLAATLVRQKTPYALGMRLSIPDDDARAFSRTFYDELARGIPVEEALFQARLSLAAYATSSRLWIAGVPVLYTALAMPAPGFICIPGIPTVREHRPPLEVSVLPRAEGVFQGRIEELKLLGSTLTGDNRPPLMTIHGGGGLGKTALAREAVERFAYAWPGGIWAVSLENLPGRADFVINLAHFLGIATQEILDLNEVERQVVDYLTRYRTLILLDNAETLVQAVEAGNTEALHLAQFLREQLPRPPVGLLATSRFYLGWAGEIGCELSGLEPAEGIKLFEHHAPQRAREIDRTWLWQLSEKVAGHPLSLRLLSSAFNAGKLTLQAFVEDYEVQLSQAENKYVDLDHSQRTLYTSIETSVHFLNEELRTLLSGLWIFHAPFLAEAAAAIFTLEKKGAASTPTTVYEDLQILWQRGLLALEAVEISEGTLMFYRLLPTTRPYTERYMEQAYDPHTLLARFGTVYASLANSLYEDFDRRVAAVTLARQASEDFERGITYVKGIQQGYYLLHWGWILYRLGNPMRGLQLLEEALDAAQGQQQPLMLQALNNIALVYDTIGKPQEALGLYEQALYGRREMGDRNGEAAILINMGEVYRATGKLQEALELYQQALLMKHEAGDRSGEGAALASMARIYQATGQPQKALECYQQGLSLMRDVCNRVGEAAVLNNMADVYRATGHPQEALKLYEQALPMIREMGNRNGEAALLTSIAMVHHSMGKLQEALDLYEQAFPIMHEVANRAGEAAVLTNMAVIERELGHSQEALRLYEQVLPVMRAVGDRTGEASVLINMATVYDATGKPHKALELYEQTLPIMKGMGNRTGEATILTHIAGVFQTTDKLQEALPIYERALLIMQEVGNRIGEATSLSNMALVYDSMGKPDKALKLHKQSLSIIRAIEDKAGEAVVLNNIAGTYYAKGQLQKSLKLYKQALRITEEIGHRGGQAAALVNMAGVYDALEQPQEALALYEQALPILRAVESRAGESAALVNLAKLYQRMGQSQQALQHYEEALPVMQEVGNRAGEVMALTNMSTIYYQSLHRAEKAITLMEYAITVLEESGLPQDAAGQNLRDLKRILQSMRKGAALEP